LEIENGGTLDVADIATIIDGEEIFKA